MLLKIFGVIWMHTCPFRTGFVNQMVHLTRGNGTLVYFTKCTNLYTSIMVICLIGGIEMPSVFVALRYVSVSI